MTTTATHNGHDTTTKRVLCMACELSETTWKLGCTVGHGQKPRERRIPARHQTRGLPEVAQAKKRLGRAATAPVVSCYAAGREGFWLHRFLPAPGITNVVVDSSSIAITRRQRRTTSDAVAVRQFVSMLRRDQYGERQGWHVVHVPSVEAEDQRHRHRALESLQQERARTTTRIKGLLSRQGGRLTTVSQWPEPLEALRRWDGSPLPGGLRRRVLRVDVHHQVLSAQSAELDAERRAALQTSPEANLEQGRQLRHLRGIGIKGAWVLVRECFGGRACKNRREGGG